jgi:molybdopterin converting factor small subunit
MQIELEVFGSLRDKIRDRLPHGRGPVEVRDGATIDDVAGQLGLTIVPSCVVMVDGRMERNHTRPLDAHSKLTIIPPVAGG